MKVWVKLYTSAEGKSWVVDVYSSEAKANENFDRQFHRIVELEVK